MAQSVQLDDQGNLLLGTPGGILTLDAPVLYQDEDGVQQPVSGGYVLNGTTVSFQVGAYDPTQPLVIDPVLDYSTYLGGNAADAGDAIAVDRWGQAYLTGQTLSLNFPTNLALQSTGGGSYSAFVSKLTADGRALLYSTYLGSGNTYGNGIAVDASGAAYVAGTTSSSFWTSVRAFLTTRRGKGRGLSCLHRANGLAEQHDGQDELRGGPADGSLDDAADVIGGAGQVAEDDGGRPPVGDEREHDTAHDQHLRGPGQLPHQAAGWGAKHEDGRTISSRCPSWSRSRGGTRSPG